MARSSRLTVPLRTPDPSWWRVSVLRLVATMWAVRSIGRNRVSKASGPQQCRGHAWTSLERWTPPLSGCIPDRTCQAKSFLVLLLSRPEDVACMQEGAAKAAKAEVSEMTLQKGEAFGSAVGELSFAGDVSTVPRESSGGSAEVAAREEEVRGRVKSFSFPHAAQPHPHGQAPHLQKVAEEANGQLMDEMTRVPTAPGFGGAASVSSVIPGLENMSGTQMIHAVLADKERADTAAA